MKKCTSILPLFLVISSTIQAQAHYLLMVDKTFSMFASAENLITLHKNIYTLQNRYLRTKWLNENTPNRKTIGVIYRLSKTIFIENVIDHITLLVQHEVFGHGSRFREFGYEGNTYYVSLPPPYGKGNGWARAGYGRQITSHEKLAITIAGSEANTVVSNSLRLKWLQRGKINYRETVLYSTTSNDLALYILTTRFFDRNKGRNDIRNYLRSINRLEGLEAPEDYQLTLDDLARQALINILNPFQYFSLYAYFKTYLWSAQEYYTFPRIKLWNIEYLPSFRLGLTPFGSEYYFNNFIVSSEKILDIYVRYGDPTFHRYWGTGIKAHHLIKNENLSVNIDCDIWNQPSFFSNKSKMTLNRGTLGGAILYTVFFQLPPKYPLVSFAVSLGYKTDGFLEGERLGKGFILRMGLGILEQ